MPACLVHQIGCAVPLREPYKLSRAMSNGFSSHQSFSLWRKVPSPLSWLRLFPTTSSPTPLSTYSLCPPVVHMVRRTKLSVIRKLSKIGFHVTASGRQINEFTRCPCPNLVAGRHHWTSLDTFLWWKWPCTLGMPDTKLWHERITKTAARGGGISHSPTTSRRLGRYQPQSPPSPPPSSRFS